LARAQQVSVLLTSLGAGSMTVLLHREVAISRREEEEAAKCAAMWARRG
jgi:hypothetical protein